LNPANDPSTDRQRNATGYEYFPTASPSNGTPDAVFGGYLARVVLPEGVVREYSRDQLGQLTSTKDGNGAVTAYGLDAEGHIVSTTDAAGSVTTMVYDQNNKMTEKRITNVVPVIGSDGRPTGSQVSQGDVVHRFEYDILGKLTTEDMQVGAAAREVTRHRYDRDGNRVLSLRPEWNTGGDHSNVVSLVYDERNLLASATRGGLTPEFRQLSANASIPELNAVIDSPAPYAAATSHFAYTAHGDLASDIDGSANATSRDFDGFQRVTKTTDALGHYATTTWDVAGNAIESAHYSSAGNLLARTLRSFDALNRVYQTDRWINTGDAAGSLNPGDGFTTERTVFDQKAA